MATKNYQFRLIVLPSPLGLAITSRLEAPGADRTAVARRWLELGFAAEQAGFQLDGNQLRHSGRAWDVQPTILPDATVPASADPATPGVPVGGSGLNGEGEGAHRPDAPPSIPAPRASETTPASSPELSAIAPALASTPLLNNLRNLSAA